MDKYLLRNYVLDYIPTKMLGMITIQNVNNWSDFLFYNEIFELKNIYEYLNHKLKQFD